MSKFILAVDIGGTFTDFMLLDASGRFEVEKVPTSPDDPAEALLEGLEILAARSGLSRRAFVSQIGLLLHGTTVTTNAVLTRNGVPTAVLTTTGFRDMLAIRRGLRDRRHLYDNKYVPPPPLVPRELRFSIPGRMNKHGDEVDALDEQAIRAAGATIAAQGVRAVAIGFMHAYANDVHERRAATVLQEAVPTIDVSTSAAVVNQVRLYPRLSTTVLNAYTRPILGRYLGLLDARLRAEGFAGVLLVMQSNGGVAGAQKTERLAAATLLSGPAAGPTAGAIYAAPHGAEDCVVIDMGGTSFDASLVRGGVGSVASEGEVGGLLVSLPLVDIHTIGAGGGSIAWVDEGGILHVGPESAGAIPGPACYGRGGAVPTVTDADLVLGFLNPDFFLGGRMKLDTKRAESAIEAHVGNRLGLGVRAAAAGIVEVINFNMAAGIKEITVQRGYDPREFLLVAAGGAGGVHGAAIARELGITHVVIPRQSSVFCAAGMLASDLKHDYLASYPTRLADIDPERLRATVAELVARGRADLEREGVDQADIDVQVGIDMRYVGQHHEITVPIASTELGGGDCAGVLARRLDERHDDLYGFSLPGAPAELVVVRVTAVGQRDKPDLALRSDKPVQQHVPKEHRQVFSDLTHQFEEAPVYDGEEFLPGMSLPGPAILEATTTTVVVPPDFSAACDELGSVVLTHNRAEGAG